MEEFTALKVDTPRRNSTEDVAFATSANVEHSGKVAPSRKVAPSVDVLVTKGQALSPCTVREDTKIKTDADSLLPRLKMLHSLATLDDDPGLGSAPDSSLLLQLRICVTSTTVPPCCLTNETTIPNKEESGDSAGPSPFCLALKKSEQGRRLEVAAVEWAALGRRFKERNALDVGRARSVERDAPARWNARDSKGARSRLARVASLE
jgi:hypothetical protein